MMAGHTMIATQEALAAVCAQFAGAPELAVDFEGEWNCHRYGNYLCLIQVADADEAAAIDPKAPGIDLKPLLDLIEIVPTATPPVCKIMDFGKFVYKLNKLAQKQRARQKKHEIKGIRLSVRTDKHDLETKIKKAREFLGDGHSLKVTLIFKGREIAHSDFALEKMITLRDALVDVAKIDQEPKKQGYNLFMVLSPINH